ncbi:MAG: response regulator [Caulobacter sp.]|nr:response regulator [Caulobacter sp.]
MDLGLGELKVLLVDDNDHMRTIVGTILKGIGILNVREARDGSEALEALRTWPADLAIVDFRMEPMDGVDFTRLIRNAADSRNPFLPIIMMTGFADRPRVEEARDSGVTELIVKPVTARAIIDRLNAVVYRPRPFVRTADYFGPRRRGIDDIAPDETLSSVAHI